MGQVFRIGWGWSSFLSKSTATVLNTDAGAVYAAGVKLLPRDSFSRIKCARTSGFWATMYVCGTAGSVVFNDASEVESIPVDKEKTLLKVYLRLKNTPSLSTKLCVVYNQLYLTNQTNELCKQILLCLFSNLVFTGIVIVDCTFHTNKHTLITITAFCADDLLAIQTAGIDKINHFFLTSVVVAFNRHGG